jgi:hypothetical protein
MMDEELEKLTGIAAVAQQAYKKAATALQDLSDRRAAASRARSAAEIQRKRKSAMVQLHEAAKQIGPALHDLATAQIVVADAMAKVAAEVPGIAGELVDAKLVMQTYIGSVLGLRHTMVSMEYLSAWQDKLPR